jgi:hypothetical protein
MLLLLRAPPLRSLDGTMPWLMQRGSSGCAAAVYSFNLIEARMHDMMATDAHGIFNIMYALSRYICLKL